MCRNRQRDARLSMRAPLCRARVCDVPQLVQLLEHFDDRRRLLDLRVGAEHLALGAVDFVRAAVIERGRIRKEASFTSPLLFARAAIVSLGSFANLASQISVSDGGACIRTFGGHPGRRRCSRSFFNFTQNLCAMLDTVSRVKGFRSLPGGRFLRCCRSTTSCRSKSSTSQKSSSAVCATEFFSSFGQTTKDTRLTGDVAYRPFLAIDGVGGSPSLEPAKKSHEDMVSPSPSSILRWAQHYAPEV